jgi:hypothetical protein
MKNKAAQQLGRLGGKSKTEAKTSAARTNGAAGGRPGMYSVMQDGDMVHHSISATQARNEALALVDAGKTGVFVTFYRKQDGQRGYLNRNREHALTGVDWSAE